MAKLKLRFQYYFSWFLLNFIFCLLPIGISYLIKNSFTKEEFLSFLSFTYTLLIGGIYLFDHIRSREESQALFWSSLLFAVALIVLYCLVGANANSYLDKLIFDNKLLTFSVILSTAVFLSLLLNKNDIERKISKKLDKAKMQKSRSATNNFNQFLNDVNDEL